MANYSFSRNERAYVQSQAVFGTIPNSSGTATLAGSNALRFIGLELQNDTALLERPDKTGTRSQEGMTAGRKVGRWSISLSLVANGSSTTIPDCDPILSSAFGQTATVTSNAPVSITSSTSATPIVVTCSAPHGITSGTFAPVFISGHTTNTNANGAWLAYASSASNLTLLGSAGNGVGGATGAATNSSVAYTLSDSSDVYFALWSYRTPSTLDQRVGHTCTVSEMTFNINQDVATWSANGSCEWVLRSSQFSSADSTQKGGLVLFPTEPVSPVTHGAIIPGFTGNFAMGQSLASSSSAAAFVAGFASYPTIRNATISIQTANMLVRDTFGSYYATMTEGDVRVVSISYSVYDDDSTQVASMKNFADVKTPVDFFVTLGTQQFNTWSFWVKNVYLASHNLGDGQLRFEAAFDRSRATTSTLAVRDEIGIYIM